MAIMIKNLKEKLKSLALADAILEREWQYRYFSYDSNWGTSEEMASMRDGQGGHWFVLFEKDQIGYKCISPEDGFIKDFQSFKGNIPPNFFRFINEPAFYVDAASAIWLYENSEWTKYGKEIKWLIDLPKVTAWEPKDYSDWAKDYYERDIDLDSLIKVFERDLSEEIIMKLNSEITLKDLSEDLKEIGVEL